MQAFKLACCVGVITAAFIAYTVATVGGQYSVNVHFVPPLHTASCQIAQFWSPPNVTCALCFCMTGSLSRCIPQPGCRPNSPQNSTTTMRPDNSTASPNPDGSANPPNPDGSSQNEPASPAPEGDTPTEAPTEKPESSPGKVRAAKPGKSRRRRHSGQSEEWEEYS